jgi:hypothetical protein
VDLTLFQISTQPNLPPLTISTTAPTTMSSVTMIGYGGDGGVETCETNNVMYINQSITPKGYTYVSNDFLTLTDSYAKGSVTSNTAQVISGDSGGGDFIYNSSTSQWELAGVNEVNGVATIGSTNYGYSGMVQLDTYATQINAFVSSTTPAADTPTMPIPALFVLALLLFLAASRRLGTGGKLG